MSWTTTISRPHPDSPVAEVTAVFDDGSTKFTFSRSMEVVGKEKIRFANDAKAAKDKYASSMSTNSTEATSINSLLNA